MKPDNYPKTTKHSIFSYGVKNLEYDKQGTLTYISLSEYCRKRFISRYIAKKLAKKGWLLVTKGRNTRISVHELCPEQINNYLGIAAHL